MSLRRRRWLLMIQSHPVVLSIRAGRGGRGRAPMGDLVCPFPPHYINASSDTPPSPPQPKGVIFARHCHAPLLVPQVQIEPLSHTHTHTLSLSFSHTHAHVGTRPQLTLWHSCYGTKRTSPRGPGAESAVNGHTQTDRQTHTQTHLHTCGYKPHKQSVVFLDHDGYCSRGGQRPWYWAICQGGEFCVCALVFVQFVCTTSWRWISFLSLLNYIPAQTLPSHPAFCLWHLLFLCRTSKNEAAYAHYRICKILSVCVYVGGGSFKRVHAMLLLLCADFPCVNLTPTCMDNLSLSLSQWIITGVFSVSRAAALNGLRLWYSMYVYVCTYAQVLACPFVCWPTQFRHIDIAPWVLSLLYVHSFTCLNSHVRQVANIFVQFMKWNLQNT